MSVYDNEIADSEKFSALRKVQVLRSLGEPELWELVHAARWTRAHPQTPIVTEGKEGHSLFFLASGNAKVTRQGRLLGIISSGEYFGEMAYIKGGSPRQATIESISDVVVAEFEPAMLAKTRTTCQLQLCQAPMHSLVDRLSIANDRLTRGAQ